jgi:mycofactocin system transcriptional regulator
MSGEDLSRTPSRTGRQRSTSVAELSHVGLRLFVERGFDETTVDDIAEAAGIGRRTFFRYFPSKNDLPWGEFDTLIVRMRQLLADQPPERPLFDALRIAVLEFNRYPDDELPYHRQRMELLLNVPTLVAHSTLRYAAWRHAISDFAAERLGAKADDLAPQTIGWTFLAVSLAAYEQWLREPGADLLAVLDDALEIVRHLIGPPAP